MAMGDFLPASTAAAFFVLLLGVNGNPIYQKIYLQIVLFSLMDLLITCVSIVVIYIVEWFAESP